MIRLRIFGIVALVSFLVFHSFATAKAEVIAGTEIEYFITQDGGEDVLLVQYSGFGDDPAWNAQFFSPQPMQIVELTSTCEYQSFDIYTSVACKVVKNPINGHYMAGVLIKLVAPLTQFCVQLSWQTPQPEKCVDITWPVATPTEEATAEPTEEPTEEATDQPTEEVTEEPTEEATETVEPTATVVPTSEVTTQPTSETLTPVTTETSQPTVQPLPTEGTPVPTSTFVPTQEVPINTPATPPYTATPEPTISIPVETPIIYTPVPTAENPDRPTDLDKVSQPHAKFTLNLPSVLN